MKYLILLVLVIIQIVSFQTFQTVENDDTVYYNSENGLDFLYYSKASYCDADKIQNWDCGSTCDYHPDMTDIHVITNKQYKSQQYVAYDPQENLIVVAFRGSSNIRNWLSDFHYNKKKYPFCDKCKIHSGFMNVWESVEDEVLQAYYDVKNTYPSAKLLLTGHSLGAAIASVAALEFRRRDILVDFIYVYASPRTGNSELAEYASTLLPNLAQVIHYKDPVPHLPPKTFGFIRFMTETWYYDKHDDSLWEWCPSEPGKEDKKCSDKYSVFTNFEEHTHYLGHYTGCGEFDEEINEENDNLSDLSQIVLDKFEYNDEEGSDIRQEFVTFTEKIGAFALNQYYQFF